MVQGEARCAGNVICEKKGVPGENDQSVREGKWRAAKIRAEVGSGVRGALAKRNDPVQSVITKNSIGRIVIRVPAMNDPPEFQPDR